MRWACLSCVVALVSVLPHSNETRATEPPVNVIVYKEAGRFGGWPANHGIWAWGNEIVLGHRVATFKVNKKGHAVDGKQPQYDYQARSIDGGLHWQTEQPAALARVKGGGPVVRQLTTPIDFTQPDFAFMCRYSKNDPASRFYFSYDRAKTWSGPFRLPTLGQPRVMGRTDCLVSGPHEATLILTAAKRDNEEGRIFVARTTDGGLNWRFVSWIGPEPSGFSIMPSSVRLSKSTILTSIRREEGEMHWIDAYLSSDNGNSWNFLNKPVPDTGGSVGNPPHLIRLHDGRLAITYGFRSPPYGIRARLSSDQGRTWSREIVLRKDGGCWDLGYPRSVERPDGRIVTAYYFNDNPNTERYIAATIWTPEFHDE
jgi:hypothetical protein